MEHTIRNAKSRLWLVEYPPGHRLHKLKFAWSLEWMEADRFPSKEAAEAKAKELGLDSGDYFAESVRRKV